MSDVPFRPLFPGPPPELISPAPPPPMPSAPGSPSPAPPVPGSPPGPPPAPITAAQVERAIFEVFARRFGAQMLPYGQARILAILEHDLATSLTALVVQNPGV